MPRRLTGEELVDEALGEDRHAQAEDVAAAADARKRVMRPRAP